MTEKNEFRENITKKLESFRDNYGDDCKQFAKGFVKSAGYTSAIPYVFPTIARDLTERIKTNGKSPTGLDIEFCGAILGMISAGSVGYVHQLLAYHNIARDHPGVWAIPVMTNVASGIYEYFRIKDQEEKENEENSAPKPLNDLETVN